MSIRKRIALACGGLLILGLLFVTLLLPGIIISRASDWVTETTGRSLTIESISINPLALAVEINGLALSERDHTVPFVSWERLRVALSPQSVLHRAPILRELRLDRPSVHLERLGDNSFNFSDLLPAPDKEATGPPPGEPARFSINNLAINDGRIVLDDSSLAEPVHHTINDLQLRLPVIGNLPYMVDNPAQPLFSAVVNDSPINLAGTLKPFSTVQEMQFGLKLDGIDLPYYLGYVPVEMPVEIRKGKLNLDLDIRYRISPEAGGELELSGRLDLLSLDIWDRMQEQLFFLPLLQVEIAPSKPLANQLHIAALRVYNLEVRLTRDRAGVWNHARMATAKEETAAGDAQEEPSTPFNLLVDAIHVRDGVVRVSDSLPDQPFTTVAKDINLDVRNATLAAGSAIPFDLALETERGEAARVTGQLQLTPLTLEMKVALRQLSLGAYAPYYIDIYQKPFEGTLDLAADLRISPEQPLLVSNGRLDFFKFYSAFNEHEGLGIERADISGLSFDLANNRLEIDSTSYSGGHLSFSRDKAGEWSFMSRNFPILAKLAETAEQEPTARQQSEGPPFSYRIGKLAMDGWTVDVRDSRPAAPAEIAIADLTLEVSNLAAPQKVTSPFSAGMTLQRKGRVEVRGSTSLADQETTMSARLKDLPLAAIAPYVAEQADLILADGLLDARLTAAVTPHHEALQVELGGDVGLSRFHLLDSRHREDLLKWDSLQLAGIKTRLDPLTVAIESITLNDYFAKVLIDEETRLNLVEAFRKAPAGEQDGDTTTAARSAEPAPLEGGPQENSPVPDIRVDTIILQGGRVDFSDRHLPRPFHADMRELGGRIEGLSSASSARAEVDLRGSLRGRSPLTISGAVNPLAEELFLDLRLNFTDIELSPLSPYSGTYVGYLIEKGKLNLALDYSIEKGRLKAKNEVFLDQFTFGDKVESDKATSLPVTLAVALLKDRRGEIHLDIPVTGSLDDPQFSIGSVIWTIIKNLLVKAATSPFALLGALVGGGDEDFSSVSFEPGSARLTMAEQDKLQRMAQALRDRPGLKVEVSGFVDPESDPEGARRERLFSQVRRLRYLDLVKKGKLPEGIKEEELTVPDEEYADYLWEAYRETDFPKPRNFIGMTKKLPAAEMEKLIYANTDVTADDLALLAEARATAVQNFLIEQGQLEQERIFLKKPDITAAPDQETANRARAELGAAVR